MAITNNALVIDAPATSAPPVTLGTNLAPELEMLDIREPVYIPPDLTWLWILLGVSAVLALAGWIWWRWFRPGAKPPPLPVRTPPHKIALAELDAILRRIHEAEPFCTGVSGIARVYLENQFELRAPERTTEEFLYEVQDSDVLDEQQKASLGRFLEQCDMVKFARYEPAESELKELHEAARRLVEETMPSGGGPGEAVSR
jgi:hypothetical protein